MVRRRLLRLLAEQGGRLETEEARRGQEQADRQGAREHGFGAEGGHVVSRLHEHRDVEDHEHQHLEHEAHPEDLGAEVDADPRQHEADDDRQQTPDQPVHVEAREVTDDVLHEEAAGADRSDHEEVVAERGDEARDETARATEALHDEGIEAAGVHELLRHLRVSHGEQQQDRGDQEEGHRCAATVSEGDRQGGDDHDARQRCDGGEHEEDDPGDAERAGSKRGVVLLRRGRRYRVCHVGSFAG